jgi:6-pyruvoyltetrahydropterin/6-carboxytetrahydropterin synthase
MIRVTRKYRFSASHRLRTAALSDEENRTLYGKCDNPYGHGHNYEIAVSARGPLDPRTARVLDPAVLDRLVEEHVLRPFDHRNLNEEIQEFRSAVPTTENLANEIFRRLRAHWKSAFPAADGPALDKISIAETPRNIFEVSEIHGQA